MFENLKDELSSNSFTILSISVAIEFLIVAAICWIEGGIGGKVLAIFAVVAIGFMAWISKDGTEPSYWMD